MSSPEVDPHMWPDICRASLLEQLRATSAADEGRMWTRLLPKADAKTIGLCVHDHCPLDGPHWRGGIWRSGHMRSVGAS